MLKGNNDSKAQNWELEVVCKNKKYMGAIVKAIVKIGKIGFEVEVGECFQTDPSFDASYNVLMWCSWFINLGDVAKELVRIESKFEQYD